MRPPCEPYRNFPVGTVQLSPHYEFSGKHIAVFRAVYKIHRRFEPLSAFKSHKPRGFLLRAQQHYPAHRKEYRCKQRRKRCQTGNPYYDPADVKAGQQQYQYYKNDPDDDFHALTPVKYSISKIFCKSLQRFAAECCFICVRTFSFNAFLLFCCAFPGAASFLLKALDF